MKCLVNAFDYTKRFQLNYVLIITSFTRDHKYRGSQHWTFQSRPKVANQPTDESDREAEHCSQTEKEASIFKALPQSSTTEQNDLSLMSLQWV